jgi:aspartyl-tRNA(Asn)/glutamyl-tRNA(Gln) amidotransferase subunit C
MAASSPVDADVVRKIAVLARLTVDEADLPRLADQLSRIVAYVDQLEQIPETATVGELLPPATPVRPDAPEAGGGRAALEENAPKLMHGYGAGPRVVGGGS